MALLWRRRRALATVAAIGLATTAHAKDTTPAWGNFELRYGNVSLVEVENEAGQMETNPIEVVYGETGNGVVQLEFGPQFYRVVEVDLGLGFFQELAWKLDEGTGLRSSERTMLTWWPLSVGITGRIHILDEQVLVPFARIGGDYLVWNERWDDGSGEKAKLSGAKIGWHFGFGGNLLLDTFASGRASMLESQTGINDTFLVVEWRRQMVEDGQGLVFSGDLLTVGLKLDY